VTVCLVEDNQHLREQLERFLLDAGVAVVAAVGTVKDGERAIVTHQPDVAVIDLRLPDGTGIDLIRTVAQTAPQVTLVLHSSSATAGVTRDALEAGAASVIPKSIRADGLLDAILRARSVPQP
jgi:two-component system response regulator DevR